MWQKAIQEYLRAPASAEADEGFRAEILRLSKVGLQVIGGVEIGVTAFMIGANLLLDPDMSLLAPRLLLFVGMVTLGTLTILSPRVPIVQYHGRIAACLSGLLAFGLLTWFFLYLSTRDTGSQSFIPGTMTLVVLATVAAVPLKPFHTLYFGGLIVAVYVVIAMASWEQARLGPGVESIFVIFGFTLTLLACALSTVLYNQRRSMWDMHRGMLRASEEMRESEARNLVAQNAASVGRLAAALSHELNSPVGALVSAVDTLLLLAARQATSPASEQQRLVHLQNDLRRSIRESTTRLREIVARMQRFTNLDKAEVQSANINNIISDVIALLEPSFENKAHVDLQTADLPELICRPQQLSAVFSSLLGNALEAGENVRVYTFVDGQYVVVRVEDNGRGLAPDQVAGIFDPGFRVENDRVSTGNWSMFSSRQIVREHGGDIHLASSVGAGTRVDVRLPIPREPLS